MKRFLKQILLFGFLFFIVEKGLYYLIQNAPEKEYDKRLELVLKGEMEKDLIIIGSSRGANNISAKQLEDETGLSAYNLSYRGSNVNFHKFILETVLIHNINPKKVLMVIDNGYEFLKDHSLHFRYDRLRPLKNYRYINNELIKGNKKNHLSKLFYSALVDREDFSLKPKKVYPINIMTSHGSKLIQEKAKDTTFIIDETKPYNILDEESRKLSALKAIQDLCSKNEIELYFVFTPIFTAFDTAFFNRFKKLVNSDEHIIVYDTLDTRYKDKSNYRDPTHLYKKGAHMFTSEISTFVNSNKDTHKNENSLNNRN